jgi:hypothetical protein
MRFGQFAEFQIRAPVKKSRCDTLVSPRHPILIGGIIQGTSIVVTARWKGRFNLAQEACRRTISSNVLPGREFWSDQGGHREELGADEQTTN